MPNWETLYEENGDSLVLYARQFVSSQAAAEDIVHDSFVKLFQKQETLNHPNPKALLFQSVRWTALDRLKQDRQRKLREDKSEDLFERSSLTPDIEGDDFSRMISELLLKLPESQREVLVLHLWGDLTFREISEQLEISPNTAASRYRYALEKLRESSAQLQQAFPEPSPAPLTLD